MWRHLIRYGQRGAKEDVTRKRHGGHARAKQVEHLALRLRPQHPAAARHHRECLHRHLHSHSLTLASKAWELLMLPGAAPCCGSAPPQTPSPPPADLDFKVFNLAVHSGARGAQVTPHFKVAHLGFQGLGTFDVAGSSTLLCLTTADT